MKTKLNMDSNNMPIMTSDEIASKLETYCKELYYIQQSFFDFNGVPTLPPAQLSKYNTLIIAITDFLNDAFGENRYEPMIKKIHNDCIADGLFEPTPGSIEGIISVLRATIIRIENNPNCTATKNQHKSSEVPNPTPEPTNTSSHKITAVKKNWQHSPLYYIAVGVIIFILGAFLVYLIKMNVGIPL
jgi:hypothetical protein